MENIVIYTVKLDKTSYEFKGNGWGITDVVEDIENKNTYHYRSKERALHHLRGFLDSRPESESWEKVKCKGGTIAHYRFKQKGDCCFSDKVYNAYVTESRLKILDK